MYEAFDTGFLIKVTIFLADFFIPWYTMFMFDVLHGEEL